MTESVHAGHSPLITFALFAYNQERFIAEALRGAFNQTYSPLEVILSDDCSSDSTFEIMRQMADAYSGPHIVRLNRNGANLGIGGHINRIMEKARGQLIVVAAGDDVSLPERTVRIAAAFEESAGRAFSIFSDAYRISADGQVRGIESTKLPPETADYRYFATHMPSVVGSTQAWHRAVFDLFGPMDKRVVNEDVVIPFRAAILGQVVHIEEVLVLHREHQTNVWRPPPAAGPRQVAAWQLARAPKFIEGRIGTARTFLQDLDVARETTASTGKDHSSLRSFLKGYIEDQRLEMAFLAATPRERWGIVQQARRLGIPPRRVVRWILQYSFPTAYYLFVRHVRRILTRSRPSPQIKRRSNQKL